MSEQTKKVFLYLDDTKYDGILTQVEVNDREGQDNKLIVENNGGFRDEYFLDLVYDDEIDDEGEIELEAEDDEDYPMENDEESIELL
ncbi:MAG: hypothetical protein EZS28_026172 [Streblomastix strix]|uniref:DUF1292 domain-containing protein n=1 Tax=Streblomastix strix TaxID=222440 RepID=A0A5J4V662_9EUKA|nr:MAG: hypothetical protein EZS28_026172 [Streblomastix strix]